MKNLKIMRRLALTAAGFAAAIGLAFAGSGVAQAYAVGQYCNWPARAATQITGTGYVVAYSPGGSWLGERRVPTTWYTPWEDVRFVTYSGNPTSFRSWCYW